MGEEAIERAEQRRAAEEALIDERNAAQRRAEQDPDAPTQGEQPLMLPGEQDAAAVTDLPAGPGRAPSEPAIADNAGDDPPEAAADHATADDPTEHTDRGD